MTRKEELIKELEAFFHSLGEKQLSSTIEAVDRKGLMATDWDDIGCSFGADEFADFILLREKHILDEVEKPLKQHDVSRFNWGSGHPSCEQVCQMVDQALATINRMRGEK